MNIILVVAYIDLIEFLFHIHRTKMMDTKLWPCWKALAETLMDMPKFKKFGTRQNTFIILISSNLWIHCDLPLSFPPSFLSHNLINHDFILSVLVAGIFLIYVQRCRSFNF